MSLDRSLKSANSLVRHRNVLTRDERLAKLKEAEKWDDKRSVFGLPKVAHRKMALAKAVKEETADAAAAPAGAAAPAPAKGRPPGKGCPPRQGRRRRRRGPGQGQEVSRIRLAGSRKARRVARVSR